MAHPTVALVLPPAAPALVEALSSALPTWVGVYEGRSDRSAVSPHLTSFAVKKAEAPVDAALRIAYSLDDHYSEVSQTPGYKYLIVFGCELDVRLRAGLRELGFADFDVTPFCFVAKKS